MSKTKIILMGLFAVFALLNSVSIYASNFICAQDLDGNGDVTGIGEKSSCQAIGAEQFCNIGAQTCTQNIATTTKYQCKNGKSFNDGEKGFETLSSCESSCQITEGKLEGHGGYYIWYTVDRKDGYQNYYKVGGPSGSMRVISNDPFPTVVNIAGIEHTRGAWLRTSEFDRDKRVFNWYENIITKGGPGQCSSYEEQEPLVWSCPTPGNSCADVNGTQKCSINPCIDLDSGDTVIEISPDLDPPNEDNGNRNKSGACTDTVLLFDGKGMRCRYQGWFGLADNCCKNAGQVLSDSTGSYATSMATKVAMKATWQVLKGAYASYHAQLTYNLGTGMSSAAAAANASTYAASGGQAAMSSFSIDPTTLAISLAIQVFMDMMGCEQVEQEAAIYKGSGYCHEVGSFCSKKVFLLGCVEKSKGMCCYNSKLARIMQEQGRVQLGKSWGSAENPSCGGFNPNEFQSLDFSRIDMSEYYGDIKSSGESLIQKNITDSVQDYYRQIRK